MHNRRTVSNIKQNTEVYITFHITFYITLGSFHKAFEDKFYPKFELRTNFGIRYVSSLRCPNFRTQLMIELIAEVFM